MFPSKNVKVPFLLLQRIEKRKLEQSACSELHRSTLDSSESGFNVSIENSLRLWRVRKDQDLPVSESKFN